MMLDGNLKITLVKLREEADFNRLLAEAEEKAGRLSSRRLHISIAQRLDAAAAIIEAEYREIAAAGLLPNGGA